MDARPVQKVTVVACMDARLDLFAALGLELGDAHLIRNAGGVVTDDTIRSLTISQRALGTRSIALIHHTGCGLLGLTEDFRRELEQEVGQRPTWAVESFVDLDGDVRQSMQRVRTSRSSRTATTCADSSSTCTPVCSARSTDPTLRPSGPASAVRARSAVRTPSECRTGTETPRPASTGRTGTVCRVSPGRVTTGRLTGKNAPAGRPGSVAARCFRGMGAIG